MDKEIETIEEWRQREIRKVWIKKERNERNG